MIEKLKKTILKSAILLYIVSISSVGVNAWTDKNERSKDKDAALTEEKIDKKPKEGFFASIAQMRKDLSKVH